MASTISAGTTSGTALNIQSDTTGNLAFKTGASNVTAMTLDSNQNVTFANNVTYTGTITATLFSGSGANLTTLNASNISSGTLSTSVLPTSGVNASTITTGTLGVANGGTGATTLTANNVVLGNGTSAVQVVAPGTSGNVLSSNGTTWVSTAPSGGVTSLNGQTGAITNTDFGAIGSYITAIRPITPSEGYQSLAVNSTIAGSSLRYSYDQNIYGQIAGAFMGGTRQSGGSSYNLGGTAPSGTWRCMSRTLEVGDSGTPSWYPGLFVRIS